MVVRSVKVSEYLVTLVILFFSDKKHELNFVWARKILLKISMLHFCFHVRNIDKINRIIKIWPVF
jgi:hypothetical protein